MQNSPSFEKPRWLRDFLRFLPLKSQFVLTGNVRDLQAYEVAPQAVTPLGLVETLTETLHDEGYGGILFDEVEKAHPRILEPSNGQSAARKTAALHCRQRAV